MRTIRITGKGRLKIRPDMTRISLYLQGTFPEYEEALRRSSEDTAAIGDLLTNFGFQRTDLKTLQFNVDTAYETYEDRGMYKERFIGYQYRHEMKVEFPSDHGRLGKILYALARCSVKPEFRLSYTVKDPEAAKNELLGKAIEDAKAKSAVLTQAAGVLLKEIQSIDYSWGQINFEVEPMCRTKSLLSPSGGAEERLRMDIEPEDIEVSDTVTVVWEIE